MSPLAPRKHHQFLILLSFAFVTGLVVAAALCGIWRYYPGTLSGQSLVAAIAVCPPYLLTGVLEATTDSTLALVMTIGTIIFANGFLYAGLASFLAALVLRKYR